MKKKEYKRPDEAAMLRVLEKNKGLHTECVIRLAWTMGFSVGEMNVIKWPDVSFETGEIALPDRRVPMDQEMQKCLEKRYRRALIHNNEFVVVSDRSHQQMHRGSIARAARVALDTEESLRDITLVDLREDFVIRQLEHHDAAYVAKISGMRRGNLLSTYSEYTKEKEQPRRGSNIKQVEEIEDYEYKLWMLTQTEGGSPEGLAIWLVWQLGMTLEDIVSLTWEQVNFEEKTICVGAGQVPMGAVLERRLRQLRESRSEDADPHVLLSPKAQRAFRADRLSRIVGDVLIKYGLEDVALPKLGSMKEQQKKTDSLMQHVKENGYITVVDAAEILQASQLSARNQLKKLVQYGLLTAIGFRYYSTDTVIPPERQEEVVIRYIKENGGARRKDLAELLGIEERQCAFILKTFIKEGKLSQLGTRYYLGEEVAQLKNRQNEVLAYLEEKGTATARELASILHIEPGSVKAAMKELVEEGMLIQVGKRYGLPEQKDHTGED